MSRSSLIVVIPPASGAANDGAVHEDEDKDEYDGAIDDAYDGDECGECDGDEDGGETAQPHHAFFSFDGGESALEALPVVFASVGVVGGGHGGCGIGRFVGDAFGDVLGDAFDDADAEVENEDEDEFDDDG